MTSTGPATKTIQPRITGAAKSQPAAASRRWIVPRSMRRSEGARAHGRSRCGRGPSRALRPGVPLRAALHQSWYLPWISGAILGASSFIACSAVFSPCHTGSSAAETMESSLPKFLT